MNNKGRDKNFWKTQILLNLPLATTQNAKILVVAYRWWLSTRINPQVISSEKSSRHIYILEGNLLHAISKLRCAHFHVVTQWSWYTLSGKKILQTKISHHASSGCLQEVKNNGNYKTVSPKSGHGHLGEVVIYESF